jgi:hypothetical protein
VANLPDDNDNYREALNLLDDFYKDNKVFARKVITDLLDCPKASNSHVAIKDLYMTIHTAVQTLQGLSLDKEALGDVLLTSICEQKLPQSLAREWVKTIEKKKDDEHPLGTSATIADLLLVLRQALRTLPKPAMEEKLTPKKESSHSKQTAPGSFATAQANEPSCLFCKDNHASRSCPKFPTTVAHARSLVAKAKVCWICLDPGHMSKSQTPPQIASQFQKRKRKQQSKAV